MTPTGGYFSSYAVKKFAVRPALDNKGFSLAEKLREAVMRGFINFPSSVLT